MAKKKAKRTQTRQYTLRDLQEIANQLDGRLIIRIVPVELDQPLHETPEAMLKARGTGEPQP